MTEPASFDPSGYPWQPIPEPGVIVGGTFRPTAVPDEMLASQGAAPMRMRHPVLAVGSNASAAVMDRKLAAAGICSALPMTVGRHDGLAVGHSAHVSMPGYIAAAPYRCGRCRRPFVVVHPDDDQLEALDATEPNYERVRYGEVWVYRSRWEVLAVGGLPVTLRPQRDLHRTLTEVDPRFRQRFAGRPPHEVTASLAHDGSTNEWRHHWRDIGLTRHSGLG